MAPTFRHGKGTKVYVNTVDASSIFNDFTGTHECEAADATPYGKDDRQYVHGLRRFSANLGGMFDGSTSNTQKVLNDLLGSSTMQKWTVGVEGSANGRSARLWQGNHTSYEVSAPADGVVAVSAAAEASSRVDVGHFHTNGNQARTSTGSGTQVARVGSTAASSLGGVGHLHLIAQSTLTSITVKVQHSSAGASWADLISFTASTSTGVQRSTVAGTVKRYTRETVTAFTGGAGKTVTYVVAFARR